MWSHIRGQLRHISEIVGQLWAGDYVVLCEQLNDAAGALVREVLSCGGKVLGIIAANDGCDPVGTAIPCHVIATESSISRAQFANSLRNPSDELRSWLDVVDDAHKASLISANFFESTTVAGRTVLGGRPTAWSAYEDKTRVDDLFRELDVAVPPAVVVPPVDIAAALRAVGGDAIVALDSSTDFRGDSFGLRWVRGGADRAELDELTGWAATHADRVRVARFVDGVPCSVLGVVVPAGVAVFDPIEIVTLRDTEARQLFFAGSSNHWWPNEDATDGIRAAARRVGEGLASAAGYSGFFSLDGILAPDGFVATKLNPRLASGLGLTDFPIYLFSRSLGAQPALFADLDPALVEDEIRRAVRRRPSFSLRLPALQKQKNCPGCASAPTRTADCGVTYRERCDSVVVVAAEPVGPQRLLGPVVAELGRELGWKGLTCYPTTI